MNGLGANTVYNHADYRLMSKRALKALLEYKEVNLFLRGLIPMIGYKSDIVEYERNERFAGKSKYSVRNLFGFATDGITSLSIKPIRMITFLGAVIFFVAVIMMLHFVIGYILGGNQGVKGWTSLILSIWGIGGLQLLAIGVVGEYIGKIYLETKGRPRFLIEEYLK